MPNNMPKVAENKLNVSASGFTAILELKCPRCRKGRMFITKPYSKNFTTMEQNCEVCNLHFEIEPGFFWGAMYVSYAFTVGISLTLAISTYFIGHDPDVWVYLAIIAGTLLVLTPFLFRYARVLMMHAFSNIKFDKNFSFKKTEFFPKS